MFRRKDALENFAKFTGKHLYWSRFFNKIVGLRPVTLLKSGSSTGDFCEIFKDAYFVEHLTTAAPECQKFMFILVSCLTLYCIMLKNGQTYFKNI